jgi:hypothetical protein
MCTGHCDNRFAHFATIHAYGHTREKSADTALSTEHHVFGPGISSRCWARPGNCCEVHVGTRNQVLDWSARGAT